MQTTTLTKSSVSGGANESLKLPIDRALGSLTVDLDSELMRYRKARKGDVSPPPPRRLAFRQRRKALDLIRVNSRSAEPASPPAQSTSKLAAQTGHVPQVTATLPSGQPIMPPPPPRNPRLAQPATRSDQAANPAAGSALIHPGGALAPYQPIPEDHLESTEALLRSAAGAQPWQSEEPDYTPSLRDQLATPLGMGALLLLLLSSAGLGYLVTNPSAIGHLLNHPAVQALRPQPPEPAQPSPTAAETVTETPPNFIGMGPNLADQEFVDLNLQTLSTIPPEVDAPSNTALALPRGANANEANSDDSSPSPQATDSTEKPAATPTTRPTQAAGPSNIPNITVAPAAPRPATVAPVISQPATPRSPAPRPAAEQPRPQTPAPRAAAPTPPPAAPPAPLAAPPAPLPANPPANSSASNGSAPEVSQASPSYYVVTDYTGDQSLSNARTAVGDAYVRNFPAGARIQMGAFAQEGEAQNLVQQLENQGIPAQIYTP